MRRKDPRHTRLGRSTLCATCHQSLSAKDAPDCTPAHYWQAHNIVVRRHNRRVERLARVIRAVAPVYTFTIRALALAWLLYITQLLQLAAKK